MSHQGIVVAAVTQAAESTEYARGSIPTQTADCTATAARPGWTASSTRDEEARSARNGSRDDGLVQTRGNADRGADGRREAMLAVQRTTRLAMGLR
jgi:hypothetical protein